jgi:hypothetical protein
MYHHAQYMHTCMQTSPFRSRAAPPSELRGSVAGRLRLQLARDPSDRARAAALRLLQRVGGVVARAGRLAAGPAHVVRRVRTWILSVLPVRKNRHLKLCGSRI